MRFSLAGPQVFTLKRPVLGDAWADPSSDPLAVPGLPPVQDSTPFVWDAQAPDAPVVYDPLTFDYSSLTSTPTATPSPVENQTEEKPTDWMSIFSTSAKALSSITPAVTGIMSMQQQNKAQQAANDLALAQAKLAASRSGGGASSGLPSWVLPVALGGVVLLAAGFFLTRMPRSAPATNPRKHR